MSDQAAPQQAAQPQQEISLSPSAIAEMKDAAAALKQAVQGPVVDVGMNESGQLSPSHTPGRGR